MKFLSMNIIDDINMDSFLNSERFMDRRHHIFTSIISQSMLIKPFVSRFYQILVLALLCGQNGNLLSQTVINNYSFSAVSGTFTSLTGSTAAPGIGTTDNIISTADVPIGFTFSYGGVNQTLCRLSSNGQLIFGSSGVSATNNDLSSSTVGVRPGLAPLWDDLQPGAVSYLTTGATGNRVFTAQWLNMEWSTGANISVISFQVKLYESTGVIEFIYRQEAGAVNNSSSGASIGLIGSSATDFISLQSTLVPATSNLTSQNGILTKPSTGQIYRFTPTCPFGVPSISGTTTIACTGSSTLSIPLPTGGTITTSGNYRIHTFTSNGTFTVPAGFSGDVEYLIVAGGGGGGGLTSSTFTGGAGGGGAGGMLQGLSSATGNAYSVVVGSAGTPGSSGAPGGQGGTSSFNSISAVGGGGGASTSQATSNTGAAGGSGGGGRNTTGGNGGAGSAGQGNTGSTITTSSLNLGGGGGGAGSASANNVSTGGTGLISSISGSNFIYARGGSGGNDVSASSGAATASSTGNGGDGANGGTGNVTVFGGAGGSGIVLIRYIDPTGGSWTSSNISVATVNSSTGVVTAGCGTGTTTITYSVTKGLCTRTTTTPVTVSACGIPNPGTASISSTSGCSGVAATLSATGLSTGTCIAYQWQSGPNLSGPWTDISGATGASFVVNPTATIYYRIVTTNANSALTNNSNVLLYTVLPANTPGTASSSPTICINTALTAITRTTSGATGIGTPTGLPAGVTATWVSNVLTISGTPTASGTFNYSIPLTGGCGTVNATGIITVTAVNTSGTASSNPTLCINTLLSAITRTTTGATGIGTATGLPAGVAAAWASNTLTISGTPTASGTFNYSIPLTGGCGIVNATGTITVTASKTAGTVSSNPTLCINTPLTAITRTTTGATGIGAASNLPAGVTASWASNVLTISGTPTIAGTFNYSIPLTGGCGTVNATGTITVTSANTAGTASSNPTLCINTPLTAITRTTTGATGIGAATNLPLGVTASWVSNILTISGTPTVAGTFNYTIPLTGGCGTVNATGTITVLSSVGLNAPTGISSSYCSNQTFNITNNLSSICNFNSGNTFTVQLSDATGSFASPANVSAANSATSGGTISVTLPAVTVTGAGYLMRVVSTNPVITSPVSGAFTITPLAISVPAITGGTTSFCQGGSFVINYTVSCAFPTSNVFTAQLSDETGSFASPTNIGTVASISSGSITANIGSAPAGIGYRLRIISSSPLSIVSPINANDLTVDQSAGVPSVFGNGAWNAYVYAGTIFGSNPSTINSNIYLGTYIENNLSFNTTSRWVNNIGPNFADNSQGATNAYQGCPKPGVIGTNYAVSLKRTNIPCGYYQINLPYLDDQVRVFINGVQVFQQLSCCVAVTNAWTGVITPSTTIEFQFINFGGPGSLQVALNQISPLTLTPNITQCSTPSVQGTLSVSSPLSLSYVWSPTNGLSPSSGLGSSVTAAPTSSTTYTVVGTDAISGCTFNGNVVVTISNVTPTVSVSSVPSIFCSGFGSSVLTATGGLTYTWSPAIGLSSTTGAVVTANPPTTTIYTVTASNGCTGPGSTGSTNATVTVQNIPTSPPTSGSASFGNNTWNVFCHYNNTTFSNLFGYYTENNLSFNTISRWASSAGPSVANSVSGLPYNGCSFPITTLYSMSFRRTNFTCGYYQLDLNFIDDQFALFVDGIQVYSYAYYNFLSQTNVWRGFLGPSSQVELRLINTSGPGQMQVTFSNVFPQTITSNTTICAGTDASLAATSSITGATYSWAVSPADAAVTFSPSSNIANPTLQTTASTAFTNYTVTNALTDASGTGCTVSRNFTLSVNPLPNTSVSPVTLNTYCPSAAPILTASGASSYSWSPPTGLSATTGFSVNASPTVSTIYTVTGSNGCGTNSATATVNVLPLPAYTSFPTGTWNIYGFNSMTVGTNYQGYYTENNLSFISNNRWGGLSSPSAANAASGLAWIGCTMNNTNYSLSAKRTSFTCGIYQIDLNNADDSFVLLVNGVEVARSTSGGASNAWTGFLGNNSTVELQFVNGSGVGLFKVTFTNVTPAGATVWNGFTSNDWFTASNWCGGVPTATSDVLISANGTLNMPIINGNGAVARGIIINSSLPATVSPFIRPFIPAASLTINSTFNLNVNGNWLNNGSFFPNSSTLSFVSGTAQSIGGSSLDNFANLRVNKSANNLILNTATTVAGTLTMNAGNIVTNASNLLTIGTSDASPGSILWTSGTVVGPLERYFSGTASGTQASGIFPVGLSGLNRYAQVNYTGGLTTGGTIIAEYIAGVCPVGYAGLPNDINGWMIQNYENEGYWEITPNGGDLSTANYSLTLRGNSLSTVTSVPNMAKLRIIKSVSHTTWDNAGIGSHTAPVGGITDFTITNSGMTGFSWFNIGSGNANPLPVQMLDFAANCNEKSEVDLNWTTASEQNSEIFIVERSRDFAQWENIAFINAAGNSNYIIAYATVDANPYSGVSFYRLVQVDNNGVETIYGPISASCGDAENSMIVFPNPTKGNFTVEISSDENLSNSQLVITDMSGKVILTRNINVLQGKTQAVFEHEELQYGMYIIQLISSNLSIQTVRFVVN